MKKISFYKNEIGMSIVEVMVALGITTISLFTIIEIHLSDMKELVYSEETASCEVYQDAIMANLKGIGPLNNYQALPPYPTNPNIVTATAKVELFHDRDVRWDDSVNIWEGGSDIAAMDLRTPYLITGNVNALLSVMKWDTSPTGICNTTAYFPEGNVDGGMNPTLFNKVPAYGLTEITHGIKITPFELLNTANETCNPGVLGMLSGDLGDLFLAPQNSGGGGTPPILRPVTPTGWTVAPPAEATSSQTVPALPGFANMPQLHPDVRSLWGLRLQLETTNTWGPGYTQSCVTTEMFSFPSDSNPPLAPAITTSDSGAALPPASDTAGYLNCNAGGATTFPVPISTADPTGSGQAVKITFGYILGTNPNHEPGTMIACRDRSMNFVGAGGMAVCGANPSETHANMYLTCPSGDPYCTFPNPDVNYQTSDDFVPCELLKVCGRPPETLAANDIKQDPATGEFSVELTYTDLPYGCEATVEVAAMDPSGNYSDIISHGAIFKIHYPECGGNAPADTLANAATNDHLCNVPDTNSNVNGSHADAIPGHPESAYTFDYAGDVPIETPDFDLGSTSLVGYYRCNNTTKYCPGNTTQ